MPYRSYAARLSSSLRISYAAATFLNMASARSLSSRFLSGCQRTASLRYARRISSPPAPRLTPRRAYRSSSIPTCRTAVFLERRLEQILRRVSKVFDGAELDDAGDPRCLRPECDVEMRPRVRDSPREPTLALGTT